MIKLASHLSVIVPAYRAEETLFQSLESIRGSDHPPFELIVVDDGSGDATPEIAEKFAHRLVRHESSAGRSNARNEGARLAGGETLVFIDSDVVVKPESLHLIARYFDEHPEVDALTGMLSKEHPHPGFFSQYKNLYMHHIFTRLPDRVSFLYGSIHAIRRRSWLPHGGDVKTADDTALGQKIISRGGTIAFLKNLEVVHLKKHGFLSWIKNDFQIPFDWAQIFLRYRGWRLLGKNRSGFLHSPKSQLAAVMLAPAVVALVPTKFFFILLPVWLLLNLRIISFFAREKGGLFGAASIPVTFLDHLVMASGIACGILYSFWKKLRELA